MIPKPVVLIFLLFLAGNAVAQKEPKLPARYTHLMDSANEKLLQRWNADSLKIVMWSDSAKAIVHRNWTLDSLRFLQDTDTLRRVELEAKKVETVLDSLRQKKRMMFEEVDQRQDELLGVTHSRLEKWRGVVGQKLSSFPADDLSLPNVPALNADFGGLPSSGFAEGTLSNVTMPPIPELELEAELGNLNLSPDLGEINQSISLPDFQNEKFAAAGKSIQDLNFQSANSDQLIEKSMSQVDGFKDIKNELQLSEGIRDNEFAEIAEKIKEPEALKQQLEEQAVEMAVDHFAGKEQILQESMAKISKLKKKYVSLNSLKDIPKRRGNPMKDVPFVERVVPGVGFQILSFDKLYVDVNPYLGYRVTPRITMGAGWNQRIGYEKKQHEITSISVIYGPRAYVEYRIWKGFSPRLEGELMNSFVPPPFKSRVVDHGNRAWVTTVMIGLKKEYRFMKSVQGTAFVMFKLYDPQRISPYNDVMSSRFGFEFPIKKGKSKDDKS